MAVMKAASRHVLLAEMILGSMLLAFGMCGAIDNGSLHVMFKKGAYNIEWVLPLALGLFQFLIAVREWCYGRRWELIKVQGSVVTRGVLAGGCAVVWVYSFKEFFFSPTPYSLVILLIVAPVAVGINLYSVVQNRKVWVALNPDIHTSTLTFYRDE